jgi:hypothetical protein
LKFDRLGRWPLIEELFQTNQEHRFLLIKADQAEHWQRKIPYRKVQHEDPRHEWGNMIYNAYRGNTPDITKELIRQAYPYSIKETILEEYAKILAQGLHPDLSATEKSDREHAIPEEQESSHHEASPDWLKVMT